MATQILLSASSVSRWGIAALVLVLLAGCADAADRVGGDGTGEPVDPNGVGAAAAEDIVIPAEGMELAGALRMPESAGPAPAVVIVHGSGPLSRDGLLPGQLGLTLSQPVPVYRELAESLVARGYAVLTWDKRTCGPFNGCADNDYPAPPDDLTFETLRADAGAVLDVLAGRDDIDEVVVVGHSKGGTISAGLVAERDDLAGLVLMATPAVPITEVLDAQAEKLAALVAAGDQQREADQAVTELRELAAQVTEIGEGQGDGPPVGGASRRFWASWIDASLAAPDQVGSAGVPVLALGGQYDWNVPAEQMLAWEPHLGEHGRVEVLSNITHALTYLETDDVDAISAEDVGEHLDSSVVDALASWLDDTLDP